MLNKIIIPILSLLVFSSFLMINPPGESQKYKCMIQLTNYTGEGAYIVVSVLDKDKNYLETLHVLGDDNEWYPDIPEWWKFHSSDRKTEIDGITGATIAGGERSIFPLEIDDKLIDAGNFLRFETSVEHQDYHHEDLQLSLSTETLNGKFEGNGYIRYVRLIANK